MSDTRTSLDIVRKAAQDLHRKASANIANLQSSTAADLKAVQDEAHKLAASLKTAAGTQSDAIKAKLHEAVASLEAAEVKVKASANAGKDHIKQANTALIEGAHTAAARISSAVADLRGKNPMAKPAAKAETTKVPA
jgi:hypothetical protein